MENNPSNNNSGSGNKDKGALEQFYDLVNHRGCGQYYWDLENCLDQNNRYVFLHAGWLFLSTTSLKQLDRIIGVI